MSHVFFTDRDLGKKFPAILRSAGLAVERHADHFQPDASDETWLAEVSARGWIALTHDRRIRYKPNELAAVVSHRVALLVIVGHTRYEELAKSFVNTLPRVEAFLAGHEPPFIAKVFRPSPADVQRDRAAAGRVELWYPRRG